MIDASQKVTSEHLKRKPTFTCGNQHLDKFLKTPRAPSANTHCASVLLPWAGLRSGSLWLTAIKGTPARRWPTARASRSWSEKWEWGEPALCLVWRYRG